MSRDLTLSETGEHTGDYEDQNPLPITKEVILSEISPDPTDNYFRTQTSVLTEKIKEAEYEKALKDGLLFNLQPMLGEASSKNPSMVEV